MIDDEQLNDQEELTEEEAVVFVEQYLEQLRAGKPKKIYIQPPPKLRRMDPKVAYQKAR